MEENSTSWKNHSFTLIIFGGIVVLSSIFFVLGMLVGRNQGQRIAEQAYAAKAEKSQVAAVAGEEFKLNYYTETTEDNPRLELQPPPSPPAAAEAPAKGGSSTAARAETNSTKTAKPSGDTKARTATPESKTSPAVVKPATARTSAKTPAEKKVYLQVFSSLNEKQAQSEAKRAQSKKLSAQVIDSTVKNQRLFRVYVGPYKESEVALAKTDLKSKGYKDAFVAR